MLSKRKTTGEQKNVGRKVCFGSGLSRNQLVSVGPKASDYPGPFEHCHSVGMIRKYPNKKGYTLLASTTPRDKDFRTEFSSTPPVGTYDIESKRRVKQSARPFGMGSKLKTDAKFVTPGPGTNTFFKRQIKVCTAFGHDRIAVPLVQIVCSPFNMAYCTKCEATPIGDYWHKSSTNQDMCRACMDEEWADLRKCSTKVLVRHRRKNELRLYTLMRYCDFFHEHNCTKAAVQHMPTKDLIFKLRKENYLSTYGL